MAPLVAESYLCPRCHQPIDIPTGLPRQFRCMMGCTTVHRF